MGSPMHSCSGGLHPVARLVDRESLWEDLRRLVMPDRNQTKQMVHIWDAMVHTCQCHLNGHLKPDFVGLQVHLRSDVLADRLLKPSKKRKISFSCSWRSTTEFDQVRLFALFSSLCRLNSRCLIRSIRRAGILRTRAPFLVKPKDRTCGLGCTVCRCW
jgi:hypothetical protein